MIGHKTKQGRTGSPAPYLLAATAFVFLLASCATGPTTVGIEASGASADANIGTEGAEAETGEASTEADNTSASYYRGHRRKSMSLADVGAACDKAKEGPGIAIIDRDLRDANTKIELPDCVLHLEKGADVQLRNVQITGGILNIHDRDTKPARNRISLRRVTIDNDALLIELNDRRDTLTVTRTDITTAQGIGMQVAGTREDANDGGKIWLSRSSLLSTDADATIHILASEHSGKVRLFRTTIDTRGLLTVLAHNCRAFLDRERLDCSTAAVESQIN